MRYIVNINDIESALISLGGEGQAKEIQNYILREFCSGSIPSNYQHEKSFRQTIQRKMEDFCPQAEGFDPVKREGKFIRVARGTYRYAAGANNKEFIAIEEIESVPELIEGAGKSIIVNAYERNPEARKQCIKYHGISCVVCSFNFEKYYGELGKAFIHIHHVKPLAEIKSTYVIDPINDLIPLCANCHAMVHRVNPPLTIAQLKEELQLNKTV